jgi:hypothetical protein
MAFQLIFVSHVTGDESPDRKTPYSRMLTVEMKKSQDNASLTYISRPAAGYKQVWFFESQRIQWISSPAAE